MTIQDVARSKPPKGSAALFRFAAAALFISGMGAAWSSASAQEMGTVMELGGRRLAVSPQEMRALSDLGSLAKAGQKGPQNRALAEARRVANSRDARYVLALYELEIGVRRADDDMRANALDTLLKHSLTAGEKRQDHLAARGQIAYKKGEYKKADEYWTELAELRQTDPDALANLAQVRLKLTGTTGMTNLLTRAITSREESGRAPEIWYRQRLSTAQAENLVKEGVEAAQALVDAYPTPANFRAALVVYRQLVAPEGAFEIDLYRLMRHANVLAKTDEYQRMAQLLRQSGEPREAKAVLDEGLERGLLDAGTSPTREIIAEVDRAIARAGSGSAARSEPVNAAGAQVRLGMSQLFANRRTEAGATFRSVPINDSNGRYGELADFWLKSMALGQPAFAGRSRPVTASNDRSATARDRR